MDKMFNVVKVWGGWKQIWATYGLPWTQGMGGMLRGPASVSGAPPSGEFHLLSVFKTHLQDIVCIVMRYVYLTYDWKLTFNLNRCYSWRTSMLHLSVCMQEGVVYRCKFRKGQFPDSHKRDRSLPLPFVPGCTVSELSNDSVSTSIISPEPSRQHSGKVHSFNFKYIEIYWGIVLLSHSTGLVWCKMENRY